ncbi:MAG: epoxyqueuosine reductase QueH [Oscillospiraceae bacterium]|nr:epoxyqueuosine reductase QueH [Oscillospiraceae bacterium]
MQNPQKINYDLEMMKILDVGKPDVLLHVCCAPCSSAVLERISQQANLTLFFYNPNIIPEQEYHYRLQELQRLVQEMTCAEGITILEGDYHPEKFLEFAQELAEEPERGARCRKCIAMRLEETAKQANALGADYFATTLTLSPHKDAFFINTAGYAIAEQYAVNWMPSDFKKKNGYLRSIQLSKEYCLYRQDFCGCPFSRKLKHP